MVDSYKVKNRESKNLHMLVKREKWLLERVLKVMLTLKLSSCCSDNYRCVFIFWRVQVVKSGQWVFFKGESREKSCFYLFALFPLVDGIKNWIKNFLKNVDLEKERKKNNHPKQHTRNSVF